MIEAENFGFVIFTKSKYITSEFSRVRFWLCYCIVLNISGKFLPLQNVHKRQRKVKKTEAGCRKQRCCTLQRHCWPGGKCWSLRRSSSTGFKKLKQKLAENQPWHWSWNQNVCFFPNVANLWVAGTQNKHIVQSLPCLY